MTPGSVHVKARNAAVRLGLQRMTLGLLRAQARRESDGFRRWDSMAMECEYAELMYALVRARKPNYVVESGTGRGLTSRFIAEALSENEHGRLITFEPLPAYRLRAEKLLVGFPAEVRAGDSRNLPSFEDPDILFLDSGPGRRSGEIVYWLHQRPTGALIVVHDANRDYGLPPGIFLPGGDGLWFGFASTSDRLRQSAEERPDERPAARDFE